MNPKTGKPLRVLGISGSPHRQGNTEQLLDRFLEGAADAGGDTEKIILSTLEFRSCRGCNACHKTGVCVINDDFIPILTKKVPDADIVALASPIYSMSITSEMKAFIDRAHTIWAQKFKLDMVHYEKEHFIAHPGYFLTTAGMERPDIFDYAYPIITAFFNGFGCGYTPDHNITAPGMDRWGGIKGHPTALTFAYTAGKEAVRQLDKMQAEERVE
ncbi:flavodoxin family protein [Methanogenium marinum]|uniref:Flavodoxin family protein n=1 Tax=Methanogenium marinum TaxID=348610 RepID=A0A9Q4KTB0_9EURY|nr:flavodoxin family protein [Methanogenium marinum]MDE4908326.1 flavodoxin family protein [Methanogenium marinum]